MTLSKTFAKIRRLSPRPATAEVTALRHWLGLRRRAQQPGGLEAENIIAVTGPVEVLTASFDLLADLMALDHIGFSGFEIFQIEHDLAFMIAQLDMKGKFRAFSLFRRVIDPFIYTAHDIAQ
jgi:hypothetical protein